MVGAAISSVKKESDPSVLASPLSSITVNLVSPALNNDYITSVDGVYSDTSVSHSTLAAAQIKNSPVQDDAQKSSSRTSKRKASCKSPSAPASKPTSTPSPGAGSTANVSAIGDSLLMQDVANYGLDELFDDSHGDTPAAKKIKSDWDAPVGQFDASLYMPMTVQKYSADRFVLATPGGAAVDAENADLVQEETPQLTLRSCVKDLTPNALVRYHKEKNLPVPFRVQVVTLTSSAHINYKDFDQWELAYAHPWTIGTVDQEAANNPYEDKTEWGRLSFDYDVSYINHPLQEIGSALAVSKVGIVSANHAKESAKSFSVYTRSCFDYRDGLKVKGLLLVKSLNGKDVTILEPRHDRACSSYRRVKKLHVAGLPYNVCEEKTLDLLRSTLIKEGYDGEAVWSFSVHLNNGNSRSSYGYAQVYGTVEAEFLTKAKITIKGGALTISYANKGKAPAK